ncbi:MAG: hypothetical protein K2Q01_08400, partial [Rickettsiales bacterium]|nr:hypothetical protein [Rickettsiales bacterium]
YAAANPEAYERYTETLLVLEKVPPGLEAPDRATAIRNQLGPVAYADLLPAEQKAFVAGIVASKPMLRVQTPEGPRVAFTGEKEALRNMSYDLTLAHVFTTTMEADVTQADGSVKRETVLVVRNEAKLAPYLPETVTLETLPDRKPQVPAMPSGLPGGYGSDGRILPRRNRDLLPQPRLDADGNLMGPAAPGPLDAIRQRQADAQKLKELDAAYKKMLAAEGPLEVDFVTKEIAPRLEYLRELHGRKSLDTPLTPGGKTLRQYITELDARMQQAAAADQLNAFENARAARSITGIIMHGMMPIAPFVNTPRDRSKWTAPDPADVIVGDIRESSTLEAKPYTPPNEPSAQTPEGKAYYQALGLMSEEARARLFPSLEAQQKFQAEYATYSEA